VGRTVSRARNSAIDSAVRLATPLFTVGSGSRQPSGCRVALGRAQGEDQQRQHPADRR
jgi:hypothetical protein